MGCRYFKKIRSKVCVQYYHTLIATTCSYNLMLQRRTGDRYFGPGNEMKGAPRGKIDRAAMEHDIDYKYKAQFLFSPVSDWNLVKKMRKVKTWKWQHYAGAGFFHLKREVTPKWAIAAAHIADYMEVANWPDNARKRKFRGNDKAQKKITKIDKGKSFIHFVRKDKVVKATVPSSFRQKKMGGKGRKVIKRLKKKGKGRKKHSKPVSVSRKIMNVMNPMRTWRKELNNGYNFPSNVHPYINLDTQKVGGFDYPFLGTTFLSEIAQNLDLATGAFSNATISYENLSRHYEMVNVGTGVIYAQRYRFTIRDNGSTESLFTIIQSMLASGNNLGSGSLNIQVQDSNEVPFGVSALLHIAFDYYNAIAGNVDKGAVFQNSTVFENGRVKQILQQMFKIENMGKVVLQPNEHVSWSKHRKAYTWNPAVQSGTTAFTTYRGITSWDVLTTWGENGSFRSAGNANPPATPISTGAPRTAILMGPTAFEINIKDFCRGNAKIKNPQYDKFGHIESAWFNTAPSATAAVPLVTAWNGTMDPGSATFMTGANAVLPLLQPQ